MLSRETTLDGHRVMGKHASPKMTAPRAWLLSAEEKQRFFSRLDAFVGGQMASPRRRRRPRPMGDEETTNDEASTTATSVMTPIEPMGPDARDRSIEAAQSRDEKPSEGGGEMARMLPASAGKRRSLPEKGSNNASAEKAKRVKREPKRRTSVDRQEQLLQGKRVLLVPIGSDVSRKRLEIWHDMVRALGGTVVMHALTTPQKRQLLHLNNSMIDEDAGTDNADFDWERVDIAVVSSAVDIEKLQQHYRCGSIPRRVKMYTPEWLVLVRQEKRLPANEEPYDWRLRQKMAHEDVQRDESGSHDEDEAEESENEDGSDRKNTTAQEIVRAPPVQVDSERIRREEEDLRIKKEKLVNERIPIFHKLNPRFETISNAKEGHKLKTETFVCQKSSLMQANLNAHLTDPLEELMEFLHVERDIWREYSYKKIVSSLKAMRSRVSSVRDLKGLWWAKGRMRDKVVELLETGKLEKLEAKKTNPRLRTLVEMSRIWGVGPATAAKVYNMGYKSMDALRKNAEAVLSFQQQIGLKHFEDFLTKIPRSEVQQIEKTVVDEVHKLLSNATALACGSYRRGKPSSGDCDVLITDPDSEECDILPELLRRLRESGFLTDDLTHISDHHMGRCDTYMGVCRIGEGYPHRRLDIKVYPRRYFGFALLYFTGSDHFNRSMRLYARKKGWSLSDRALKRVVRVKKGVKIESGESVICPSEVDVFIALGLEYKDPTERNCFDIRFLEEDEANAKKKGKSRDADMNGLQGEG